MNLAIVILGNSFFICFSFLWVSMDIECSIWRAHRKLHIAIFRLAFKFHINTEGTNVQRLRSIILSYMHVRKESFMKIAWLINWSLCMASNKKPRILIKLLLCLLCAMVSIAWKLYLKKRSRSTSLRIDPIYIYYYHHYVWRPRNDEKCTEEFSEQQGRCEIHAKSGQNWFVFDTHTYTRT